MGLFNFFKKKEWDVEKSNANKKKMREIFNTVVENGDSYKVAYGFSLDVSRFKVPMLRTITYEYASLIIGYRESDMSIAVIQTTPQLDEYSAVQIFKKDDIKKAKIAAGQCTIYHKGGLMAGYTSFSVIEDNDEDYLVYCQQDEEADDFEAFWKEFSKK